MPDSGEIKKSETETRHSRSKFIRRAAIAALIVCFAVASRAAVDLTHSNNFSESYILPNGPYRVIDPSKKDFLSVAQRKEVEDLKKLIAREPTTRATFEPRAMIVWRWVNQYALAGGFIDPELVYLIAFARGAAKGGWKFKDGTPDEWLDKYIRELSFREDNPYAFGRLQSDLGPFEAESFQIIRQVYTLGDAEMKVGGGVLVARHYMSDYTTLQASDAKADNYITVVASRAGAQFSAERMKFPGVLHFSDPFEGDPLFFKLSGNSLRKGDTITVTYGDRSGHSRGFQVASYAIDRYPLPLYLRFDNDGYIYALPLANIAISGKPVKGVHGFAPSIVGVGEKITVSVRSEDEYYNRATGAIPGYRVFLNGKFFRDIPPGDDAITVLNNITFSAPGIYRFTFTSEDGAITGVANPILVKEKPLIRVFWGEEHGHSGTAEGQGLASGYFRFARDDARLDFAGHTEHDSLMDDSEWEDMRRNVKAFHKEGEFIAFLSYEWTARIEMGGHHNIFFRTPDGRNRIPEQTHSTLSSLYQGLRSENKLEDVLVVPHYHQGDWRYSDPKLQNLVEIMSAHGTFEWYARKFLDHGAQVGFAAGSDDHFNHPGYSSPWFRHGGMIQQGGLTAVLAATKSTDEIFNALKAGRTYATTQERIILDATLNGAMMGSRVVFSPSRSIKGAVVGTDGLESIDIIKNGNVVKHMDFISSNTKAGGRYLLTLESESNPAYNLQLTARAPRLWSGTIAIVNGRLKAVKTLGFDNPRIHQMRVDPNNPNLINFVALTLGNNNGLLLDIEETAATKIEISLEPQEEFRVAASQPGENAQKIAHPARQFAAITAGLSSSGQTFDVPVPELPYTDKITLRPVRKDIPLETRFSFSETDEFGVGDYYYIRVRQIDGALAWSSPVWIGGFPVQ